MTKYIYILNVSIWDTNENYYINMDNIYNNIYYNLTDSIEGGISFIHDRVIHISDDENVNILSYIKNNNLEYEFKIIVVHPNPIQFSNEKEQFKYYKNNIDKDHLYEFLMSICKYNYLEFSYNGRLLSSQIGLSELKLSCSCKAFNESEYHYTKFKVGDLVKLKDYDDIYRIYSSINLDKSIYQSDDPLNFVKGYYIETLNGEPMNDYDALTLTDEDLELVEK